MSYWAEVKDTLTKYFHFKFTDKASLNYNLKILKIKNKNGHFKC